MNLNAVDYAGLEQRVMALMPRKAGKSVLLAYAYGATKDQIEARITNILKETHHMNPNNLYNEIRSDLERRMHPSQAREAAALAMDAIGRNTTGFRDLERWPPSAYVAPQPAPIPVTPEVAVKRATDELAAAEAALAAKNAHAARIELIESDYNLAGATQTLMTCIKSLVNGGSTTQDLEVLAKYRKELQPLAERHGFKIVLVGNKTKATVVQA